MSIWTLFLGLLEHRRSLGRTQSIACNRGTPSGDAVLQSVAHRPSLILAMSQFRWIARES
jgi:hypothetical protein